MKDDNLICTEYNQAVELVEKYLKHEPQLDNVSPTYMGYVVFFEHTAPYELGLRILKCERSKNVMKKFGYSIRLQDEIEVVVEKI